MNTSSNILSGSVLNIATYSMAFWKSLFTTNGRKNKNKQK